MSSDWQAERRIQPTSDLRLESGKAEISGHIYPYISMSATKRLIPGTNQGLRTSSRNFVINQYCAATILRNVVRTIQRYTFRSLAFVSYYRRAEIGRSRCVQS